MLEWSTILKCLSAQALQVYYEAHQRRKTNSRTGLYFYTSVGSQWKKSDVTAFYYRLSMLKHLLLTELKATSAVGVVQQWRTFFCYRKPNSLTQPSICIVSLPITVHWGGRAHWLRDVTKLPPIEKQYLYECSVVEYTPSMLLCSSGFALPVQECKQTTMVAFDCGPTRRMSLYFPRRSALCTVSYHCRFIKKAMGSQRVPFTSPFETGIWYIILEHRRWNLIVADSSHP